MQQLFSIAAKTLWKHCQSCQRELSQRAVHQTQVSLDQHSQEAEAQISLLGNSRIHQTPRAKARGDAKSMSPLCARGEEMQLHKTPLWARQLFMCCCWFTLSLYFYSNNNTEQFCRAAKRGGKVEVWTLNITLGVLLFCLSLNFISLNWYRKYTTCWMTRKPSEKCIKLMIQLVNCQILPQYITFYFMLGISIICKSCMIFVLSSNIDLVKNTILLS